MSDKEFFMNGVGMAIENVAGDLETVTRNLGKVSYLEASHMPEYRVALEAIKNYKEVVVKKIGELFDKDAQGLLK